MGTLDTLEGIEVTLSFIEYLLQTKHGPGIRCFICIQLKSHNYSKEGGVSTPSHKEETEAQRRFSGLAESHSCYVKEGRLTPGQSDIQAHHIPLSPKNCLGTSHGGCWQAMVLSQYKSLPLLGEKDKATATISEAGQCYCCFQTSGAEC